MLRHRQQVLELLRSSNAHLELMESILDAEYALLKTRDSGAYGPLMERKLDAVERAGELESSLLTALEDIPGDGLYQRLTALVGSSPEFEQHWQSFCSLAKRCAEKNSINGAIVHMKQANLSKLLHLLHGGGPSPAVYGPDAKVNESATTVRIATV